MLEGRRTSWLALVVAVSLSACETVVVSMVEISEVAVVPASITLVAGESQAASAVVTESGGAELSGLAVTWTVDDPRIATVTAEGVVVGWAPGTTTVRASSDGVSGTAVVRVLAAPGPDTGGSSCDITDRTLGGDIEVPRNARCVFRNVRILGKLELREGARLEASNLTVEEHLKATGAVELVLADSRVYGDLVFEKGGTVTIRSSYFAKKLELKSNQGAIALSDNMIDETLKLDDNRGGPFSLLRNRSERLECKQNDPTPTGGGNVVEGRESGQCAGL